MDITPTESLDCRGLSCPMPTLKTKKSLAKLKSGDILEVLGTDPGTKNDMEKMASKSGDEFLGMEDDEGGFTRFYIRKG